MSRSTSCRSIAFAWDFLVYTVQSLTDGVTALVESGVLQQAIEVANQAVKVTSELAATAEANKRFRSLEKEDTANESERSDAASARKNFEEAKEDIKEAPVRTARVVATTRRRQAECMSDGCGIAGIDCTATARLPCCRFVACSVH